MTDRERVSANDLLWDRLLLDRDGRPVGRVDDLELSDPAEGAAPELTALLHGPAAFGDRVGGRLGGWWAAVARRLRADGAARPVRVPLSQVQRLDHVEVRLRLARAELPVDLLQRWAGDITSRLPGGRR